MTESPENKVSQALHSDDENRRRIAEAGIALTAMLLAKNHDYGSSAWEIPLLCPTLSPGDAILCRMSDKVKRIQRLQSGETAQVAESLEDNIGDLAGYGLLWLARPTESTAVESSVV